MSTIGWAIFFFMLIGGPVASILWLCFSWSKFKSAVPFTAEYQRNKVRLIISAVVAGVVMAVFLTIMAIYGVKVYFAPLL